MSEETPLQRRREVLWLLLVSLLWLLVNLLTASRSPTVWMDEVMFSDPAVSYHLGQGFTSTGWYGQTRHDLFAGCPILHQWLLAGWLKLFGLSITAVRSLGYVFTLLGVWFIWLAVRRVGWVNRGWLRLMLFVMLLTGYGMTFVYRCGRVEALLIMLAGATVLACTLESSRQRWSVLFMLGAATAWTAYHAPVCAASALVLAWLFRRGGFWRDVLAFGLGGGTGMAGLMAYIHAQDPEGRIVKAIKALFITGERSWPSGLADPSLALLLLMLFVLVWCGRNQRWFKWRSACIFSFVAVVVVPLSVWAIGRYPIYYSWMAWLLIVPGVFHALDASWGSLHHLGKVGAWMVLLAAGCMGLPARLALTVYEWEARDYTPVVELAAKHLKAEDWVFTDYAGYYAVKPIVEVAATEWFIPAMTEADKQRLNWLLVAPDNLDLWRGKLGGEWEDSGFATDGGKTDGRRGGGSKYDLRLYRRKQAFPTQVKPAVKQS
jgi:hypothetical protein